MTRTRSAAMRAGLTGVAGAALVLAILPPPSQPGAAVAAPDANEAVIAMAAGELPLPQGPSPEEVVATEAARDGLRASRAAEREALAVREAEVEQASLEAEREAVPAPEPVVVGERYTTVALNIRTSPSGSVVTTLAQGSAVSITDRTDGDWQQVRYDGQNLWASSQYLSTTKPAPATAATAPATAAPAPAPQQQPQQACSHGTEIEGGLTAQTRAVFRSICSRWPQITSYGGYRPDPGYHGSGQAIDIMVSGDLGWEIANWLTANAGALGIGDVIYSQKIWLAELAGSGWRGMEDRGSATANHYDHVHVSVY